MKANEVMLGDWVYNEVPCYVTAIYPNGTMDCQGDDWAISTDRVDPIPLTAEILEKNGFVNDFYETESIADYRTIELEGYSYSDYLVLITWCNGQLRATFEPRGSVEMVCDYVHELQHALRLCGIEKEIKI